MLVRSRLTSIGCQHHASSRSQNWHLILIYELRYPRFEKALTLLSTHFHICRSSIPSDWSTAVSQSGVIQLPWSLRASLTKPSAQWDEHHIVLLRIAFVLYFVDGACYSLVQQPDSCNMRQATAISEPVGTRVYLWFVPSLCRVGECLPLSCHQNNTRVIHRTSLQTILAGDADQLQDVDRKISN